MHASVASILRNQEENGAFVASPDFAQYHYCWLRDGSFIAYALDQVGEHTRGKPIPRVGQPGGWGHQRPDRPCDRLASTRQAAASGPHAACPLCPRRFDCCRRLAELPDRWLRHLAVGSWSASRSAPVRTGFRRDFRPSVERVGRYLDAFALSACFDVWEENGSALHTSTLACVYGGLTAAARLLDDEALFRARTRRSVSHSRQCRPSWALREVQRERRRRRKYLVALDAVLGRRTR